MRSDHVVVGSFASCLQILCITEAGLEMVDFFFVLQGFSPLPTQRYACLTSSCISTSTLLTFAFSSCFLPCSFALLLYRYIILNTHVCLINIATVCKETPAAVAHESGGRG